MRRLVAIHQPNFFPWLGYFNKISRADDFIFLDAVDYPRKGSGSMGSWTNRVKLQIHGEARWVTCPVVRMPLGSPISAAMIDDRQPWRLSLINTLNANYRKAPAFEQAMSLLRPLIEQQETNLAAFNIAVIRAVAGQLGLTARFVRQSDLPHEGNATALLASLVKAVGGSAYLAGGGAEGYQEDELFLIKGIRLVPQMFVPTPYGNATRWLPGLSVIDYLMHDGRPLEVAFAEPNP